MVNVTVLTIVKPMGIGLNIMVKVERFDYRGAEEILKEKGLLSEINEILKRIPSLGTGMHDVISGFLGERGWSVKVKLLRETDYRQDAYKEGIMLEIDLRGSLLDSVHRNFLRAQELYNRKIIDGLVQITEIDREPKFDKMRRDINAFKSVLTVPIYLIGLG